MVGMSMSEPQNKKRKLSEKSHDRNEPSITDSRFANIQSDPRYRLPGRRDKIKVDKRFQRVLQDQEFSRKSRVDRYGRPVDSENERRKLKTKYEFEDGSDDEPDADKEVQDELDRVSKEHDPLREGRHTETSSEESSSDEDSEIDDDTELQTAQHTDVPLGEVSSRLAVVNLDWDNIHAEDLMAVFSSSALLPSTGKLLKVAIYPSEFGKDRMEREELEGPPKEIFAIQKQSESIDSEESENDEGIKDSILKPDDGSEFDSKALRQYQLDRLRYYYAVLTFSSASAAKGIYDAVDGAEYLSSANFFDLRFVPDDTDFSADKPREECEMLSPSYKPTSFVTDALQHSKVKLTWDAEDGGRKEAVARAFRRGRKDIDEDDLKAYLDSDNSDTDGHDDTVDDGNATLQSGAVNDPPASRKEQERQKMRALLGLESEAAKPSKRDNGPAGGIQITFSSGLTENQEGGKKHSVFENSPEPDETTVEKYIRKEKERKQKRKEKMKTTREGADVEDTEIQSQHVPPAENEELGFEDPFFPEPNLDKVSANKIRKEEKKKQKAEREAEEDAERKQRAELELLMADDDAVEEEEGKGPMRHFDMREIEKQERQARKKNRNKKKSSKSKTTTGDLDEDRFQINTSDPRFSRLFESHEYAIDPTNPRYKDTKGMNALLEEGRKRRTGNRDSMQNNNSKDDDRAEHSSRTARDVEVQDDKTSADIDVQSLLRKIKERESR